MEANRKMVIAALVVLFGSNAGSFINTVNPNIRNDPFTGSDGAELEDRIELIELEIAECQRDNYLHREKQSGELGTLIANVKNNKELINRCMQRTGQ